MNPCVQVSASPVRWIKGWLVAFLCVLLLAGNSQWSHASPAVSEQALKAALLLKLTRFVYLPEERAEGPPHVCVLGQNPFGDALEQLAGGLEEGLRPRLSFERSLDGLQNCDFVYVARSESRQLSVSLKELARAPQVTISDIEGFARRGGMVELSLDERAGSQIRILINRGVAQEQGLDFKAQLLSLATLINS